MPAEFAEVESDRLRLRQFREEDLDRLAAAYADPGVARYIGGVQERPDAWRRMAMFLGHWVLRARQFAYEELGMRTLVSNIHPDNRASIAVAARCGAVLEGTGVLPKYGEHLVYRHPGPL